MDRLAGGYEPEWDIDQEVGRQGELYVARVVDSLKSGAAVEVKTDEAAQKWGNAYIEYQCRYRGEWRPSGISVTTADVWCVVIGELVLAAPTERVREVARHLWRFPSYRRELKRGSHPTRGVVIPFGELVRLLAYGPPDIEQTRIETPRVRPAAPQPGWDSDVD